MKKNLLSLAAVAAMSLLPLQAQVRIVNSATNVSVSSSPAFIDASSNTTVNGSSNVGKGLIFPRVDLSAMTSFPGVTAGIANSFPTRFDGMIVYNTATSGTAGVGSTSGTLSPGYWYYENKTSSNTGGTWKSMGTIAAAAIEPWYNAATNTGATANTQDIYQMGKVGIGTTTPNSTLHTNGSFATRYIAVSADTSLDITHHTVNAVHNSGTVTLTLPPVTGVTGRQYVIQNNNSGTTNVVVSGGGTIEGLTTFTMNQVGQTAELIAGNSEWQLVTHAIKSASVPSGANIYTADGTLNNSRKVSMADKVLTFEANNNSDGIITLNNVNSGSSASSLFQLRNDANNYLNILLNSSSRSSDGGVNAANINNSAGPLTMSANNNFAQIRLANGLGMAYNYNNVQRLLIDGNGNINQYGGSSGNSITATGGSLFLSGSNGLSQIQLNSGSGLSFFNNSSQRLLIDGNGNINQYGGSSGNSITATGGSLFLSGSNGLSQIQLNSGSGLSFFNNSLQRLLVDGNGNIRQSGGSSGNSLTATGGPLYLSGDDSLSQLKISTGSGGEYFFNGSRKFQIDNTGNINAFNSSGNSVTASSGPLYLNGNNTYSQIALSTTFGAQYLFNGVERMRLDGSGNMYLGGSTGNNITATGGPIYVTSSTGGTTSQIYMGSAGFQYNYNGSTVATLNGSGQLNLSGASYATNHINTSDARLKSNVKPITYGLDTVMSLDPKEYQLSKNHEILNGKPVKNINMNSIHSLGFLAQDIYKIIPEAVYKPTDESKEAWGVDYGTLVPILTKAIQEQQAEIGQLKTENKELKAEVEAIKKKLGL